MTDEQFKKLMEKLDAIEKAQKAGQWDHLYRPPAQPWEPWKDGTGFPPDWGPSKVTD
jgi:hypothetical protein